MNRERFRAEQSVLSSRIPQTCYKFFYQDGRPCSLRMAARTNSGNVYTFHIDLDGFPASCPKVFVTRMLRSKYGEALSSASSEMHTLPSENGWTRICHYGYESWRPSVALYQVYVKCRLWLEMYEAHLRTGKPIDYYLSHQA